MPIATYSLGAPTRPAINHDNGFLDTCTVSDAGVSDYLLLGAWEMAYEAADTIAGHELPDALAAYSHFLHGNGADRVIPYERFIDSDASGKLVLENAIKDAQLGAEDLFRANFSSRTEMFDFEMTGTAIAVSRTPGFPYPATQNWQKAIGAHPIWISATVRVYIEMGLIAFDMDFVLHAEDRYNFNPSANDIATGIPDQWNGQLSCSGLGQQYTNYAEVSRFVSWEQGMIDGATDTTVVAGDPRRVESRPRDRRTRERLRN